MINVEHAAARRGLGIHLQVFGMVMVLALLAIPLFGSLARTVDAGLRCAARGTSAQTATTSCNR